MTDNTDRTGLDGAFAPGSSGQAMQIYGSREPFYFLDPRPEDISLELIAHALSLQCRFAGHLRAFYSVAQHSVMVSRLCPRCPREGLMHDAAEGYIGDLTKPLKVLLPLYCEAEQRIEKAIAKRFGLFYPWPEQVKRADNIMKATEKRDLCVPNDLDWGPMPYPLSEPIEPWGWEEAKAQFLGHARKLGVE